MADIHSITGEKISEAPPAITPINVLKQLIHDIETGALNFEDILVIGVLPSKVDPSMHVYRYWDNALSLSETVHILESVKFDLIFAARGNQ